MIAAKKLFRKHDNARALAHDKILLTENVIHTFGYLSIE
jgi:hypothetical protein